MTAAVAPPEPAEARAAAVLPVSSAPGSAGVVTTIAALEALYRPTPVVASTVKEISYLTAEYRRLVEASPFVVLATTGSEGLDCSPRGDRDKVAHVLDERTLALPDRRGNNRIDSLRNIVGDPRVALLFLIPGSGTTFRINGEARITADPVLLDDYAVDGQRPRTVLIITVQAAYFQCARAIVRSSLWSRSTDPATLPTPGAMLAALTQGQVGGRRYDEEWPARAAVSLW